VLALGDVGSENEERRSPGPGVHSAQGPGSIPNYFSEFLQIENLHDKISLF
jgi:hypothetical protein